MNFSWLTERDKRVYDYLKNNTRYVSTSQLAELFFSNDEQGNKLKSSKLICRRRMAIMEKNLPDIKSFFRQNRCDKIYSAQPIRIEQVVAINQLQHSLDLNDLYIQITRLPGKVLYFKIEQKILDNIIPDIILIYAIGTRARIFFFEYDTGTESLTRIKHKIERYKAYFNKQLYLQEDWQPGTIRPELYFICKSKTRSINIANLSVKSILNIGDPLNF